MHEMILNEASIVSPQWTVQQASVVIADIAKGMADLVKQGRTSPILRMQRQMHEIEMAINGSFWSVLEFLRRSGTEREAALFWLRLAQKMPLLADLPIEVVDRFLGCEPAVEHGTWGDALVLCAHRLSVAISLPAASEWDTDELTVCFKEILPDGGMMAVNERIDNLARSSHARAITSRYRQRKLDQLTPETFWPNRGKVFPSLLFGLDVERHVGILGGHLFGTIMRRLADLDASAAEWQISGGGAPIWRTDVSPESQTVLNSPNLRSARSFRNPQGEHCLYDWHARFGNSGRIHLRFDPVKRSVEIGYIGAHLPL